MGPQASNACQAQGGGGGRWEQDSSIRGWLRRPSRLGQFVELRCPLYASSMSKVWFKMNPQGLHNHHNAIIHAHSCRSRDLRPSWLAPARSDCRSTVSAADRILSQSILSERPQPPPRSASTYMKAMHHHHHCRSGQLGQHAAPHQQLLSFRGVWVCGLVALKPPPGSDTERENVHT